MFLVFQNWGFIIKKFNFLPKYNKKTNVSYVVDFFKSS